MYDQGIICNLDDLLKNRSTDASRFAVTFDDGFESVMLNAAPVLRARKLPAIIYVSTKTIDTQENVPSEAFRCFAPGERLLSWHQLEVVAT